MERQVVILQFVILNEVGNAVRLIDLYQDGENQPEVVFYRIQTSYGDFQAGKKIFKVAP